MAKFKRGDLVRCTQNNRVYAILNDRQYDRFWLMLSVRAFSWDFEVDTWDELQDYMKKRPDMEVTTDYTGYITSVLQPIATGDEWQLDGNDQLLVKGVPFA